MTDSSVVINPGDTVSRYFYFRNKNGVLIDPDSIECTVKSPSGESVLVTLVKVEVGKYEFNYTLPENAAPGVWSIWVKAQLGVFVQKEPFSFVVVQMEEA